MPRELSAGGVCARKTGDAWEIAVITPRGKPKVKALPKGHIDPGEKPDATALRETREETGLTGRLKAKLGDVKYVYKWEGRSIFKIVSFYLLEWESGEIDVLTPEMRVEVDRASWVPLTRAVKELSYPGERKMAQMALEALDPSARLPAR
ncbi:MAG: NUDIX domain-containing protein [Myxococcaceae bacterium]|nr:NUDIX domain-containing protein [Myxococcaceae bacterium]